MKAIEDGKLIPAPEEDESDDPCHELESRKREVAKRAGLKYEKRKYVVVEPPPEAPSELLELQDVPPAQRARLLAD